jgi:K+-transporting ATPase ATPase C chain
LVVDNDRAVRRLLRSVLEPHGYRVFEAENDVTASASGLDPHITIQNAELQLERVASKWAADTKQDAAKVRAEIENILQRDAFAPFNGLAGEKVVNVLQVNLELRKKYGPPA